MSYHVTVTCPACGQPLEAEVDMIEETEGNSSIPYGTHTYMALDDYTIDWNAHAASIEHAASISDDVHVPKTDCKTIIDTPVIAIITPPNGQPYERVDCPLDDKLIDRLAEAGIAHYEADDGSDYLDTSDRFND